MRWTARALLGGLAVIALASPAAAGGVVGTPDGELRFEGLYANGRAAFDVKAFRASILVNFDNVARIEWVSSDQAAQTAVLRITFTDTYTLEADLNIAENAPLVAHGAYGRAVYTAEQLLAGDIVYIEFDPQPPGTEQPAEGAEPTEQPAEDVEPATPNN